ncbi:MAG: LptE family protein [Desulfarculaceae bacterium]
MKRAALMAILVTAAVLSACGYNFRGRQNNLPSDVRSVAVPVFLNHTGEERIESIFTDEVIFQFTRSQMLRVVNEGQADAVLHGGILRVDTEDVALTADETSQQRRVKITVKAQLIRRRDGKVLWQDHRLVQRRTYQVGASPQVTEINKQEAITNLARAMSQTLHDRVFENF